MVTTIQINEKTLLLLKRLKEEMQTNSYEEAIVKLAIERAKKPMAGFLGKKYGKISRKEIMQNLRDKHDRI
ncbi:MAG: hypothetical protein AABX10_03675 [Nanoarchaeota archaeon]